jgi:hypothetical protein
MISRIVPTPMYMGLLPQVGYSSETLFPDLRAFKLPNRCAGDFVSSATR